MDFNGPIEVILNPAASGGRGAKVRPTLESSLRQRGIDFRLQQTESRGHASELAATALEPGPPALVVVGGDGTLHEVANAVLGSSRPETPVAVVPVGTGNDFYRMVGPNHGLSGALDVLENGRVAAFEVGRVRFGGAVAFFVNLLGLGIDVAVLDERERFPRLTGLMQYLVALGPALRSFRPLPMKLTFPGPEGPVPGNPIVTRTLLAAVTVGPSVGGGFLLNPDATPSDGFLDLIVVEPLGISKVARYIPKVLRGTHQGLPELVQRRISTMTVAREDGKLFAFEMDGERVRDPVRELVIDVRPGALNVFVGKGKVQ